MTPDSSRIAIYDNFGSKVLFFDLEGRFLEHKEVSFWFNKFEYIDKDHVVCTTYGADDPGLKKADMQGNLMILPTAISGSRREACEICMGSVRIFRFFLN